MSALHVKLEWIVRNKSIHDIIFTPWYILRLVAGISSIVEKIYAFPIDEGHQKIMLSADAMESKRVMESRVHVPSCPLRPGADLVETMSNDGSRYPTSEYLW